MPETPVCPYHGPEYHTFNEKWGHGCKKMVGEGDPLANARGYCKWKPTKAVNGAAVASTASAAPPRSYGKSPEETRSIQAQTAMKCAVELYGPAFSIAPKDERDNLLAEMITSALRINQNIHRMSEPAPKPQPQREPVNTWTNDEPSFPDDEDAQRWQS